MRIRKVAFNRIISRIRDLIDRILDIHLDNLFRGCPCNISLRTIKCEYKKKSREI